MKKIVAIAIAVAICGVVCVIGAWASVDWEANRLDVIKTEAKTYTAVDAEKVHSVVVDNYDGMVTVERSNELKVAYYDSKAYRYTVSEKEGVLTLACTRFKRVWASMIFGAFDRSRVRVYLPETVQNVTVVNRNASVTIADFSLDTVHINSTNGSVRAENLTARGDVELATTNASVKASGVTAGCLDARTTNGSLKLDDVKAAAVYAETKNASVTLNDVVTKEVIDVKSANGSVEINDAETAELTAATTNASVRIEDADAAVLKAVSSNGSVKLRDVKGNAITLKTTNASISATLYGVRADYAVTLSPADQSNIEPGGAGNKALDVSTTNGNIKIEFLG